MNEVTGTAATRGGRVAARGDIRVLPLATPGGGARHETALARLEVMLAVAAFAVLCGVVLSVAPRLVEPDDYAYRASIVAITDGHFLNLSTAQVRELAAQLSRSAGQGEPVLTAPGPLGGSIEQWVRLPSGQWISEKNPGYPFLAAPFQALGIIRLAPLFYGALGCLGLFLGGRRWMGRFGGAAAVGLFCCSGAALLFAWRAYMPTFTEAALIAAGSGALLWAMLAEDAVARRRTATGLLGFLAVEAAVFVRYTNFIVLGCAVAAVLIARWRRAASIPPGALRWWLGSATLFSAGVAAFDDAAYGGPLKTGYRPGEITFSVGAIPANLRLMPAHLMQAMPMLVLGLAGIAAITLRRARLKRAHVYWSRAHHSRADQSHADKSPADQSRADRRDFAVGTAMAASWFGIWALYATYTWTMQPGLSTLQVVRFYVPAIGAIALLGAWPLVRLPRLIRMPGRAHWAVATSSAAVAVMAGLGLWSFHDMLTPRHSGSPPPHCNIGQPGCPAKPPVLGSPRDPR